MRENVVATWRRALFVLLAAVLALGTLPSQALAEMAEEAMGEEPAATEADTTQAGGAIRQEEGDMGEAPAPGGQVASAAPEPVLEPQSDEPVPQKSDEEAAGNGGFELSAQSVSVRDPRVVANSSMSSGQVATWDCVWLGSYPQTEVTAGDAAYEGLQAADWADGDATVGGMRYRRISRDDATDSGYWPNGAGTYRYFRYDPIKWRILKVDGNTALAVADVALDCKPYHKTSGNVTWEASAVRSWLNATGSAPHYSEGAQSGRTAQAFAEVAFTAEQLGALRQPTIANAGNTYYGTAGGNDTTDSVFLLSEAEVHGASATAHGFASDPGTYDEARRCKPTDYARAMGAWASKSGSYAGNCYWWLRSPGHDASSAASVYDGGRMNRYGDRVDYGNGAVRPALNLNLSSPRLAWAGTVSSDGAVDESRPVTSVEVAGDALTYDGEENRPAVTVWSNGVPVPDAGYDLTYDNNVDAGTATVTVVGKGVYVGEATASFEIAPKPVTVTADDKSRVYGEADPELTATVDGLLGDDTISYTISRAPGEALGEYVITPSGDAAQDNYSVSYVPGKLNIVKANLSAAEVAPIEGQLRTGSAIEPEPAVTLGGRTLVKGTDYDLSYENNVEAGTATVTATGRGNYEGSVTAEFRIGTRRLSDATLSLDRELFPASAAPAEPTVTAYVADSSETLREGRDFEVSYRCNDGTGTAFAVVSGTGDWVGTAELPFQIAEKVDISDQRSRAQFWTLGEDGSYCTSFLYRGTPVRPTVSMGPAPTVRGYMVEGRDYQVRYIACDGPGNALAVVTGIGDYTGEQTVAYTIVNPSGISLNNATVTLESPNATLQNESSGEHLNAYLRKDGVDPRPVPHVTVGGADLVEGVDYEVDYQYEHYSENDPSQKDMGLCVVRGINGASGEAHCPFYVVDSIDVAWLHLGKQSLQQSEYRWEGEPVKPKLMPRDDFAEDRDYYLSYRNNGGVGTCTVTVTGVGRFYGSAEIEVPIVEELSFVPYSECVIEVDEPEGGFVYDGSEKRPEVRVIDPKTGRALTRNANYSVSYADNVGAGTAVVRVYHGIATSSYGGYAEAAFQIAKAPSEMTASVVEPQVVVAYDAQENQSAPSSNISASGAWRHETYTNVSSDATARKFWIGLGTGFLTVPKGTAPGAYRLNVSVEDEADENHVGKAVTLSYTVVVQCPVSALAVTVPGAQTYTGEALTPKPTVRLGSATLREGTDYTLRWSDNTKAGNATVTVTGKGNFTGSKGVTFKINPAAITSVTVSQASFAYDGRAKTPGVTVRAGSLEVPADGYAVSYADNVNAGTATVTVTGKGNFTGSRSATFTIAAAPAPEPTPTPTPTPTPAPTPAPTPTKTFPDVPADAWYAGVVGRAAGLGLINGYKDGRFGPNDNVTRGQVAVILWNMAGKPAPKGAAKSFPDVKAGKYYYDAVRWASSVGVVSGYKNGTFGPDDLVTREQLAAMLANYAGKVAGKDTSGSAADYASMKDAAQVSSWAAKSVGWCFRSKIISGTKDGRVNPQGNATRAETAKMVVFEHDLL